MAAARLPRTNIGGSRVHHQVRFDAFHQKEAWPPRRNEMKRCFVAAAPFFLPLQDPPGTRIRQQQEKKKRKEKKSRRNIEKEGKE